MLVQPRSPPAIQNEQTTDHIDKKESKPKEEKTESQSSVGRNKLQSHSISFLRKINPFASSTSVSTPDLQASSKSDKHKSILGITRRLNGDKDEFKSVQSLKQFWIGAFTSSATSKQSNHVNTTSTQSNLKRSQSSLQNRLYESIVNNKTKSATLGSCGTLVEKFDVVKPINLVDKKEVNQQRINQIKENENQIRGDQVSHNSIVKSYCGQDNHKQTDNFYKYKTADLVKSKRNSFSPGSAPSNRISLNIINLSTKRLSWIKTDPTKVPLIEITPESGDKIHWAKRNDIVVHRNKMQIDDGIHSAHDTKASTINSISMTMSNDKSVQIERAERHDKSKADMMISNTNEIDKVGRSEHEPINNTSNNNSDSDRQSENNGAHTLSLTGSQNSLVSNDTPRKTNKGRKYSFRTNTTTYHNPLHRKMHTSSYSKVAALTNQFNQMIQAGAGSTALLEEVKKNKEVIIARTGGHVYKIKESNTRRKSIKKSDLTEDSSIRSTPSKKKPSVKRRHSIKSNSSSCDKPSHSVKATIQLFESPNAINKPPSIGSVPTKYVNQVNGNKVKSITKPKVPNKSQQVLLKTRELVLKNNPKQVANKVLIEEQRTTAEPKMQLEHISNTTNEPIENTQNRVLEGITEVCEDKMQVIEHALTLFNDMPLEEEGSTQPNEIGMNSHPTPLDEAEEAVEKIYETHTTFKVNVIKTEQPLIENNDTATKPRKKSTVGRIYDKFMFRSNSSSSKKSLTSNKESVNEFIRDNPEHKLIEAIDSVNHKLEILSKSISVNELSENYSEFKILSSKSTENNGRGNVDIKPNNSFLFRSISNNLFNSTVDIYQNHPDIVEAVNKVTINKTCSMDEISLPSNNQQFVSQSSIEKEYDSILQKTDELLEKTKENLRSTVVIESNTDDMKEINSTISDHALDEQEISVEDNIQTNKSNIIETDPMVTITRNEVSQSIYQSLSEVKGDRIDDDAVSVNSYESFENYEAVDDVRKPSQLTMKKQLEAENSYEICDPPEPPPRTNEKFKELPSINTEPVLPLPKRNRQQFVLQKSESSSSNYEKIKYDQVPPRPAKHTGGGIKSEQGTCFSGHHNESHKQKEHCNGLESTNNGYEENIYDVINRNRRKTIDSISMQSNCYESINSTNKNDFLRILKHSDSISTLSSDLKTNSIYETAIGQNGVRPPSEGPSDNSDEWADMSDGETESPQRITVVREKTSKIHRNNDWINLVRDQRNRNCSEFEDNHDDDSDHIYESVGNIIPNGTTTKRNVTKNKPHSGGMENIEPCEVLDDDYDSFYSDDGTDDEVKKNDSGVDVSNTKLPDPPQSTNQVYAFMQKFKLGSLSKNISKLTKRKSGSQKNMPVTQYENTTFYVTADDSSPSITDKLKCKVRTPKTSKSNKESSMSELYENQEFHTPRPAPLPMDPCPPLHTSSPNISATNGLNRKSISSDTMGANSSNAKLKSGKSFKSKLRKSLGTDITFNNSFGNSQSTFYISDSVDVDSGVFTNGDKIQSSEDVNQLNHNADLNKLLIEKDLSQNRKSTNSIGSPECGIRKNSISSRPMVPPPPPPLNIDKKTAKPKRLGSTSWYAECGVFKADTLKDNSPEKVKHERLNSSSWYAEAGLYQTSDISVASSSGSSGVSTGGEGGPGDDNAHSMFINEPLYQIYSAAKLESIASDELENEQISGYEEIGQTQRPTERKISRPTALQLVGPKNGPSRTLWSEIPEVIQSNILLALNSNEKRRQEAKFEILTSEASYLKSLNLLRSHFINHPAFRDANVLSPSDRRVLFDFISPVLHCSDRLLRDLENCWQNNIMLLDLSDNLYKHAEKYFHVYVKYCENQVKMDRTLKRLKEVKGLFSQTLDLLESEPNCCGLSLHSFLMLPMQRITRLPLLVDAVLSKLTADDKEFESWQMTLAILNKIVSQCNEAAKKSGQAYELEQLSRQIEFPSNIRPLPIVPVGLPQGNHIRALVKKGELTHLVWRGDDGKLTFGKKFTKSSIYIFLFTDLLVLTKRKNDDTYTVFDYCQRSMLTLNAGESIPQIPGRDTSLAGKHLMCITLLENHEGKMIEMIVSCPSETEQQRWLRVTEAPQSENPDEKLYEQWDCPQAVVIHTYVATQPDELSLDVGDVINITRKMIDGWYHGERIRDGCQGWFPANYTEEVASQHVRAQNLKMRYRLLTYTATFWEKKQKKK